MCYQLSVFVGKSRTFHVTSALFVDKGFTLLPFLLIFLPCVCTLLAYCGCLGSIHFMSTQT